MMVDHGGTGIRSDDVCRLHVYDDDTRELRDFIGRHFRDAQP